MQLCALENKNLIFAYRAIKQKDYECLECGKKLRVRGGNHRKAHFFHTEPNRLCRQHSKGLPHLMVQYYLKDLLPDGESEMECRFSSIGRIADVVWHKEKIVYEIQYSPISAEEVIARNLSYQSIGYRVIWILHDDRFNQFILSDAEDALLNQPHYFTNMNESGVGIIYDQFSKIKKRARIFRLPKLSIDLKTPYQINFKKSDLDTENEILRKFAKDRKEWKFGFQGDVISYLTRMIDQDARSDFDENFLKSIHNMKESDDAFFSSEYLKILCLKWLVRPYKAIFNALLERACS